MTVPVGIRQYVLDDIDPLFSVVYKSAEHLRPWSDWCGPNYSRADTEMWVRDCIDSWQQRRCFRYLIYDTQSGDILGAAGLEKIAWTHGIAELGYWVAVDAINQGVATAAAALAVQQGFAVHGLNRIEINVLCDNGPSMQVAEKIGAVLEGCFRNKLFHEGQSRAANCYSLIPSDCSIRR